MNIVSGVATASGTSARLNAPRKASLEATAQTNDPARKEAIRRLEQGSRVSGPQEAAEGAGKSYAKRSGERIVPGNGKYSKFVKAVMALRLDAEAASALTPERVKELRAAAREVFSVTDDIPRALRPSEAAVREREPAVTVAPDSPEANQVSGAGDRSSAAAIRDGVLPGEDLAETPAVTKPETAIQAEGAAPRPAVADSDGSPDALPTGGT